MSSVEVLKRKCGSFFSKDDREVLKAVVKDVHSIISEASHLLKAYYIFKIENSPDETVAVDKELLTACCKIVQGDTKKASRTVKEVDLTVLPTDDDKAKKLKEKKQKQVEKNTERKGRAEQVFKDVLAFWNTLDITPLEPSKYSISHILAYTIENTLTAYNNNVWIHYPKYVKKYIRCCKLNEKNLGRNDLPKEVKDLEKPVFKEAAELTFSLLWDSNCSETHRFVPNNSSSNSNRLYDMKSNIDIYLKNMVLINRELETNFENLRPKLRKLLSPLSLISTMIPGHIRLDTSGLVQLFMDKENIKEFKTCYDLENNSELKISNKGDVLSTFSKIFGRSPKSSEEEANYNTAYWRFLCDFKTREKELYKKRNDGSTWVFDNSVVTDGFSISFQITKKENFCKKQFGKKAEKVEKEVDEFSKLEDFDNLSNLKMLAIDPGKSDILFITDGSRTLRYTKKQRQQDTNLKHRREKTLLWRTHKFKIEGVFGDLENPSVADYESRYMSETSKKTCYSNTFQEYWNRRRVILKSPIYEEPWFRTNKFTVYCKEKSSEAKFFNKIKETFSKPKELSSWLERDTTGQFEMIKENIKKQEFSGFVIGYGNWGKNPNLKNNDPTPGIGLRRRLHKIIKTVTVQEHNTSNTNPCTQEKRTMEKKTIGRHSIQKHHLLRCTNDKSPCSWWNRNVVGSFNILYNFSKLRGLMESQTT
jgi:hypothetical protein